MKNIRICHPQEPSSSRSSKPDANPLLVSNKVRTLFLSSNSVLTRFADADSGASENLKFSFFFSPRPLKIWLSVLSQLHALIEYETSQQADRAVSQFQARRNSKVFLPVPVTHSTCAFGICFCVSPGGQVERREKLEEGPPRARRAAPTGNRSLPSPTHSSAVARSLD